MPEGDIFSTANLRNVNPRLLHTRPLKHQWFLSDAPPLLLGAVCGAVLHLSAIAYLVLLVVATIGGFLAGMEHLGAADGASRGEVGGLLFGVGLLLGAHIVHGRLKTSLPDPEIVEVVITTLVGAALGAGGGAIRGRRERASGARPLPE